MDERGDTGRPKAGEPEDDLPLEEDLSGGSVLPPGILGIDDAEVDSEAGTPPSLDIVGVDDQSTGWGTAEPRLPPD